MARRTNRATPERDEAGLDLFYVDIQLAAFRGMPFLAARVAKMDPDKDYPLPASLDAFYTVADEEALERQKRTARRFLTRNEPGWHKAFGLPSLPLAVRIKAYRLGRVYGPFATQAP
jgi:hypothetical protein